MTDCQDLYTWTDEAFLEWVDDSYYEFGECPAGVLYQVWKDEDYAYAVTSSGLDIFDINSANKVSYVSNRGGFTTIWGNNDSIYLGTSDEGVKYLPKATISGGDLGINLQEYDYYYNTSSDDIRYLHGYMDVLVATTSSGIDILHNGNQGYKSTTANPNVTKCFMTSKLELYYIVQESVSNNGVFKLKSPTCDWEIPHVSYVAGTSFIPDDVGITDIFVTVDTSTISKANTLFVATTNGAYVLDEGTTEFDTYYTTNYVG